MIRNHTLALLLSLLLLSLFSGRTSAQGPLTSPIEDVKLANCRKGIEKDLQTKGLSLGSPVFIRIFKIPGTLEVWLEKNKNIQLFRSYPICSYSGFPGPKEKEGDWQSPEGFYTITAEALNPNSSYHLSFDVGYPNSVDKAAGRTGSAIMVHGGCSSRGCFAMGDKPIEEIYLLTREAFQHGQKSIDLHIFPFALNEKNIHKFQYSPWISFWKMLEPGYTIFKKTGKIPRIDSSHNAYTFNLSPPRVAMNNQQKPKAEQR